MRNRPIENRHLTWFIYILVIGTLVFETAIVFTEIEELYLALMWVPAVSGLAACILRLRQTGNKVTLKSVLGDLGFRFCLIRYVLLGCLIPLFYLLIPYVIYWSIYPDCFTYQGVALPIILKDCVPVAVAMTLLSLLSALGEEIGWRGYLVPALNESFGPFKALTVSSLIWCLWHMPLLISGDYMPGTPLWYKLPAFVLCIFPVGIMAGILALRSKSLWPAAFLHAAHNTYDQSIFSVLTIGGDNRMYFVSETGLITIVCAWILAAQMLIMLGRSRSK